MSQPRLHSAIEVIANTVSGFVLAWAVSVWLFPLLGVETTDTTALSVTILMTVISLIRSYVWRRCFNRLLTHTPR